MSKTAEADTKYFEQRNEVVKPQWAILEKLLNEEFFE